MKYTLLNPTHYNELRMEISEALGYGYQTDTPEQIGEYSVMVITTEVQERFTELLEGLELIDALPIQPYEDETL